LPEWKALSDKKSKFSSLLSGPTFYFADVTINLSRWLLFLLLSRTVTVLAADAKQMRSDTQARYIGSASCSSSSCHGGAGEQHNQFLVWSQRDFHTKAFLILTTARSTQIAQSLGIENASTSQRCTVCHSPMAEMPSTRLVRSDQRDEGVACESCHGPAEGWLRSHTRRDYTYAMRVSSGLRDLRNIYVRANACVACHELTDREIARSGHPPLFFELMRQMSLEPPHWRALGESPASTWLTGQATALRELSWKAAVRNAEGSDDPVAAQRAALAWLLGKATIIDRSLPQISEDADAGTMQRTADELARRAAIRDLNNSYATNLLQLLAKGGNDFINASPGFADALFYRAKRLILAFQALISEEDVKLYYSPELPQLNNDIGSLSSFDVNKFVRDLESLRLKLETRRR
jgi:Cytochrome c554 and c-prime